VKFSLIFVLLFAVSCSEKYITSKRAADELVLMTYNIENLFDAEHDEGKDDYTYLPLSKKQNPAHQQRCRKLPVPYWVDECLNLDWNEEVVDEKMKRIAAVVLDINGGKGPDVLFMQEVENLRVITQLRDRYLKDFKEVILIEGPDERGIDTAILSKLPLAGKPQLHLIGDDAKSQKTRGLLQADLLLPDGSILTAFSAHLPSQHAPTPARVKGLEALYRVRSQLPADRIVVAAGDFNITTTEDAGNNLLRTYMMPQWYISHYIGCGDCAGTHAYRGTWSFLDIMFYSKNLGPKGDAAWRVLPESVQVPQSNRYQVSRFGTPERFGGGGKASGVADHFPLVVTLKQRKSPEKEKK
jgi:hypothetical protein